MADQFDSAPIPQSPSDNEVWVKELKESNPPQSTFATDKHSNEVLKAPSHDHSSQSNTYHFEEDRIKTFWEWKSTNNVGYEDLARNGFIYLGYDDAVLCVACLKKFCDWKKGDNIGKIHLENSPMCEFTKMVIHSELVSHSSKKDGKHIPTYPALASQAARLETFEFWPSKNNQNPENLAKAGFYYKPKTGKPDRVRCFYCANVLYAWERHDDPLTEHEKFSPDCEFVKEEKRRRGLGRPTKKATRKSPARQNTGPSIQNAPRPDNLQPIISQPAMPEPFIPEPAVPEVLPEVVPKSNLEASLHTAVQAVFHDYKDEYSLEQIEKTFQELQIIHGCTSEITASQLAIKLTETQ